MHDLVDREGRGRCVRMVAIVRSQFLGNLMDPFVELALRAGVERWEAADDSGLALGDYAPITGRRRRSKMAGTGMRSPSRCGDTL